jgi:hypothetical protein
MSGNGTEPALTPLVGAARNLDEAGLRAIVWSGVATAGVFVFLRLFARYREAGHFFADDYWVVAASANAFALLHHGGDFRAYSSGKGIAHPGKHLCSL